MDRAEATRRYFDHDKKAERKGPDPWRRRLSDSLERRFDEAVRCQIMGDDVDGEYTVEEKVEWTCKVVGRMVDRLSPDDTRDVLNHCACTMPPSMLEDLREHYRDNKDLESLHDLWKERFMERLRSLEGLEPEWIRTIEDGDWGEAGRLDGKMVIATKIPTDMRGYFNAEDAGARALSYCHCARLREAIVRDAEVPIEYCNCGGGFYRYNWETVLGRPVRVELVQSVLRGDPVCSFAIHLDD